MYDWLKLTTYSPLTKSFLLSIEYLNFTSDVNIDTGEVIPINEYGTIMRVAEDHGLNFKIYDTGRIEIKGSLHMFYNFVINGKAYNYNLFTLNDAVQAIELLTTMYGIIPKETTVHNLEIGVNIKPWLDISVNKVLDHVKAYKYLKFNAMDIRQEGKGKKVVYKQYKVKVYDKGAHQGVKDDILRYEIGYFKMQAIGRRLTLLDLTNSDIWNMLTEKLIESLQNVLFTDSFDFQKLTATEKRLFTFCNNSDEWEQAERTKRSKSKSKFDSLIQAKGKYKFCNLFTKLLLEQINLMSSKTCNNFTKVNKGKKQHLYHLSIGSKRCIHATNHSSIFHHNFNCVSSSNLRSMGLRKSRHLRTENCRVKRYSVSFIQVLKSNNINLNNSHKISYIPMLSRIF